MTDLPRNELKRRLRAGETVYGMFIASASPLAAEALGVAGCDWAMIDMEHAPHDGAEVLALLQAAAAGGLQVGVRPPWGEPIAIKRALDLGAQTLMLPNVQTADEAAAIVQAVRYPPRGIRGVAGNSRANRFGGVRDYVRRAEEELLVIAQVETAQAVAALPQILAVDGIDMAFVGPNDLSTDLGFAGDVTAPAVQDAFARVAQAAQAAGKPCGIFGTPATMPAYRALGYTMLGFGTDLGLLAQTVRERLATLRA